MSSNSSQNFFKTPQIFPEILTNYAQTSKCVLLIFSENVTSHQHNAACCSMCRVPVPSDMALCRLGERFIRQFLPRFIAGWTRNYRPRYITFRWFYGRIRPFRSYVSCVPTSRQFLGASRTSRV